MKQYLYKGFFIVVGANGKALVHERTTDDEIGKLLCAAPSFTSARDYVDILIERVS